MSLFGAQVQTVVFCQIAPVLFCCEFQMAVNVLTQGRAHGHLGQPESSIEDPDRFAVVAQHELLSISRVVVASAVNHCRRANAADLLLAETAFLQMGADFLDGLQEVVHLRFAQPL